MDRKKKYSLTLLEIMIVIFLIGLIGSVIGYNMKGSLEKGKAFKTERAMEQIYDVLTLAVAQGAAPTQVAQEAEQYLTESGIVKNPDKLLKDGWNEPFSIVANPDGDFVISSTKYAAYMEKSKKTPDASPRKT